jgi:cytosolic prostaglandin-E synthase
MNLNPSILWAQDRKNLFITIEINNFKNQDITFNTNNIKLVGTSGNREYDIVIDFNNDIVNEESKWVIKQKCIELVVMKGKHIFWHKLTKNKQNNIRIDWQKWIDEEDEDEDGENLLQDFSSFQKQLPEEFMNQNFGDMLPEGLDNLDEETDELDETDELEEDLVLEEISNLDAEELKEEDLLLEDTNDGDIDTDTENIILENNDVYTEKTGIESLNAEELNNID